jgi:hypothetical protein
MVGTGVRSSSSVRLPPAILTEVPRLPTVYTAREHVDAGGLMSYGPNFVDSIRRSATFVDKILKGAKPGDLPIEQPTKFELINMKTAKALGVTIPQTLLLHADQVIVYEPPPLPQSKKSTWTRYDVASTTDALK